VSQKNDFLAVTWPNIFRFEYFLAIKNSFICPSHLNSVSALPCEIGKHKNCIFSLNVLWLFHLKLQKHIVHRLSIDNFTPLSKQVLEVSSLRANLRLQTLSSSAVISVDNTLLQTLQTSTVGVARALSDSSDSGLLGEQSSQKWEIPCLGRRWAAVQNLMQLAWYPGRKNI